LNPALLFSRRHIGVGVLIGGRDETGDVDEYGRVVRTYWADDETIDEICQRGHRLRDRLGVLSGHAAGDSPQDRPPDRLLDHILELAGPAEDKLWTSVVLDRLTAEWPDLYSGWTEDTLRGHLKRWDVSTSTQIHRTMRDGSRSNQRGIVLSEVEEALARKLDGHATAGRNGNGSNGNNP
jgi:S-DNA-T family DNA segregation ATPase FtsK/SpoIIIE